jgi:hypothetical protein
MVGWAMTPEMPATLECTALQMAIVQCIATTGQAKFINHFSPRENL